MKKVVLIGAGGHACVVADIIKSLNQENRRMHVTGFLDDNQNLHGSQVCGLKVLGSINRLSAISCDALVLAIGNNNTRMELYERFTKEGLQILTVIHPSAIMASDVTVGGACVICAGTIINPGTVVGNNVIINTGSTIDHHNHIADHVHIAPGVHTGGNVKIGEGTLVGIGATVVPRCQIGDWSIAGAGTVVHKDFPDRTLIFGVPAKVVRHL